MKSENKALMFNFLKNKFKKAMIAKNWSVHDQILEAVAVLDKMLKIYIYIVFNFNSSFFLKNFSL